MTHLVKKAIVSALEVIGIYPNASKSVLERAKDIKVEDCVLLDGGDLITDEIGRQLGQSGFLKFLSPFNFNPALGENGLHTLDAVRVGTRLIPRTRFLPFGEISPVNTKKAESLLRRRKAPEQAYLPPHYLLPGQPTMIDIMAYLVTVDGVLLMAVPGKVTERWPGVVHVNRQVLE